MPVRYKLKELSEETGFWCLAITLFLMSCPRSWSLYPLGLMLFSGLIIWIIDFRQTFARLLKLWYFVLPPVIWFIIHVFSIAVQNDGIFLLEKRLMFLLVPLLGFPVFDNSLTKSRISRLILSFILGLAAVSSYLLIRMVIIIAVDFPGGVDFFSWLNENELSYFSLGFSVFEHPTYLALKINWAVIILVFFREMISLKRRYSIPVVVILASALLPSASKAGLIILIVIMILWLFRTLRRGIRNPVLSALLVSIMIFVSVSLSMRINRISTYFSSIKEKMAVETIDFKNLDQRTREWYSVIQVIKTDPLTGTGFSKAEEVLVEEYLRNGFEDEAFLKLNAHNQFLEAQMTFGILGTISLLLMLYIPLVFIRRMSSAGLILSFTGLMTLFLLIESMFNRQWGIMFFLLFFYLLTLNSVSSKPDKA
jgi:O-antigen ligase